ncbi:MAG: MBL fold metallo-hydrolase [Chloroflexota bacterium]
MPPRDDSSLLFLGTAGARHMVARQLLSSGGVILSTGTTRIMIDPGPGTIVQAARHGVNLAQLDAIVLSHRHLDHSGDVNVVIEAMTSGGTHKRGLLLCPEDALELDPVVLRYVRTYLEGIQVLREGGQYMVGDVVIETPVRHIHTVETYGFNFSTPAGTLSWITDSRFFEELTRHYRGRLLLVNVVLRESGLPIDHLSVGDVERLLKALRPERAVLTHFGMMLWQLGPAEVARTIADATGVHVIAATDGLRLSL